MNFVHLMIEKRYSILELSLRDFKNRYVGSYFGLLWMVAQQLATIVVFYFVFSLGFKAQGPSGYEFMPWFVSALVPWIFLSSALSNITSSVSRNLHIVTKTNYPSEFFPIVCLLAEIYTHFIFMIILIIFLYFYGIMVPENFFQILIFFIYGIIIILGLGYFLSALNIFSTDVSHGLTIIINIFFWFTPIVWHLSIIPEKYLFLIKWNPVYYFVEGYRHILLFGGGSRVSLYEHSVMWLVGIALLSLSFSFFSRVKGRFVDLV
jgi:ABC-type polysaccharide/polyol phosphate export permease